MTARRKPYAEYSERADAVYVYLADGNVERTRHLDDLRMVDYAADGTAIGVEFLDASTGVDLTGVPRPRDIAKAIGGFGFKVFA